MFMKIENGNNDIKGYISWSANGTLDGKIKPRRFYANKEGEKTDLQDAFKKGVVFDIWDMKIGYMRSNSAGAPDKIWGPSLVRPLPAPSKEHKRAFHVNVQIDGDPYVFEQAGFGIFVAIEGLGAQINDLDEPDATKRPVVKMTGVREIGSLHKTVAPILTIAEWV